MVCNRLVNHPVASYFYILIECRKINLGIQSLKIFAQVHLDCPTKQKKQTKLTVLNYFITERELPVDKSKVLKIRWENELKLISGCYNEPLGVP